MQKTSSIIVILYSILILAIIGSNNAAPLGTVGIARAGSGALMRGGRVGAVTKPRVPPMTSRPAAGSAVGGATALKAPSTVIAAPAVIGAPKAPVSRFTEHFDIPANKATAPVGSVVPSPAAAATTTGFTAGEKHFPNLSRPSVPQRIPSTASSNLSSTSAKLRSKLGSASIATSEAVRKTWAKTKKSFSGTPKTSKFTSQDGERMTID